MLPCAMFPRLKVVIRRRPRLTLTGCTPGAVRARRVRSRRSIVIRVYCPLKMWVMKPVIVRLTKLILRRNSVLGWTLPRWSIRLPRLPLVRLVSPSRVRSTHRGVRFTRAVDIPSRCKLTRMRFGCAPAASLTRIGVLRLLLFKLNRTACGADGGLFVG